VKEAIGRLRQAGHYAFIASGRPLAYLDEELMQPGLFNGFVLMNGAFVLADGKVLNDQPLPKETVQEIVRLCEQHDVQYVLEGREKVYLRPEFEQVKRFYVGIDVSLKNFVWDFQLEDIEVYKMEFVCDNPGGNGLFDKLLNWPGLTGLMDPAHLKNMGLYATAVTKGTGIEHALEKLGMPREQSFAFGDGLNDLEMMALAGLCATMPDGVREVREAADTVVNTVEDMMKEILLGKDKIEDWKGKGDKACGFM
jgi:Cof subfamily protein (haloacid dehalogenase superfamily)